LIDLIPDLVSDQNLSVVRKLVAFDPHVVNQTHDNLLTTAGVIPDKVLEILACSPIRHAAESALG
jgi:hypothetical protein